jgi:hypothetical protein
VLYGEINKSVTFVTLLVESLNCVGRRAAGDERPGDGSVHAPALGQPPRHGGQAPRRHVPFHHNTARHINLYQYAIILVKGFRMYI